MVIKKRISSIVIHNLHKVTVIYVKRPIIYSKRPIVYSQIRLFSLVLKDS